MTKSVSILLQIFFLLRTGWDNKYLIQSVDTCNGGFEIIVLHALEYLSCHIICSERYDVASLFPNEVPDRHCLSRFVKFLLPIPNLNNFI